MNKIISKYLTFNPVELRVQQKSKDERLQNRKTNFKTNERKYPVDTFFPVIKLAARSGNPKVNRKAPLTSF